MDGEIGLKMVWQGGEEFGAELGGHSMILDGESAAGATPMQHLAAAIAGCMAIDVVHILTRMRTPPVALSVGMDTIRAAEPPRRFTHVTLSFEVTGEVPEANIERAIKLSRETYCSAWNSIRPDTELTVETRLS